MKSGKKQGGFTLVEIMFVVFILSWLLGGVTYFFIQNIRGVYATEQRMKLAGKMKAFSNELIVHASRSNQFIIFKSPKLADFNDDPALSTSKDRQVIDASATPLLHPGGDFVVFVYYEVPKQSASLPKYRISSLVGYYLTTSTAGGVGTLQKVEITCTTPSTATVESILGACWNSSSSTFVTAGGNTAKVTSYFLLLRGLALPEVVDGTAVTGPTTPRLFYVTASRNVIVSGQAYTSAREKLTNDYKTHTNTFYFTITPRT